MLREKPLRKKTLDHIEYFFRKIKKPLAPRLVGHHGEWAFRRGAIRRGALRQGGEWGVSYQS